MTHAELLARVSSAELTEWQAYLRLENEEREERRTQDELTRRATTGVQARRQRMRNG